jgi:hypothetical protein
MEDGCVVAELLDFFHVVTAEQDCGSVGGESSNGVDDGVSGINVEAGGGFVEEKDFRLMDHRYCDVNASCLTHAER